MPTRETERAAFGEEQADVPTDAHSVPVDVDADADGLLIPLGGDRNLSGLVPLALTHVWTNALAHKAVPKVGRLSSQHRVVEPFPGSVFERSPRA